MKPSATPTTTERPSWRTATPEHGQTAKWLLSAGILDAWVTLHRGDYYYGLTVGGRTATSRVGRSTTRERALEHAEAMLREEINDLVLWAAVRWRDFEWPEAAR